jgi:dihydroneopterin aldolase
LQDTVDYGTLVSRVRSAIESDPVDLIESLAQRLADVCLEDPRVRRVEVTVHKPGAPIEATFADVTLTISRTRPSNGAPRD